MCQGDRSEISNYFTRDAIIGSPTCWKVGTLGLIQFKNNYDPDLLSIILKKAADLKDTFAAKRHLNLKYIRGAQRYIPEINEIICDSARMERLRSLAEVVLEPYPISIISSIVTFMGPQEDDGVIGWHCDGVPVTELIPLAMDGVTGGELELYHGNSEVGLSLLDDGRGFTDAEVLRVRHRLGYSILGQLIRVLHRTAPMCKGYRITLNLNLRSRDKPYMDDNNLVYLGADNPGEEWHSEFLADIRTHQLPAYRKAMGGA